MRMLVVISLLTIAMFASPASATIGWHAGPFANTFFGSCVGANYKEYYAAGYSASVGGFLYYTDSIGAQYNFTVPGIAMDVAITKNGQTLAVAGTNGIFRGPAGKNFTATEALPNSTISQHIASFGTNGFAAVGRFNGVNGVAISTNAGVSWTTHDIGLSVANGFYARYASFPSSTTWYVTSGTWPFDSDTRLNNGKVVRISGRLSVYFDIDGQQNPQTTFLSARRLLGTYPGAISKTTDGGATWTKVLDSNNKYYLNQIDCLDEVNCVAVGEDAKSALVLKTTDGGATWSTIKQLTGPYSLHAVAMISQMEYFVSGGTLSSGLYVNKEIVGNYYRTQDGGVTWSVTSFNGYGYDLQFSLGSLSSVILLKKESQMINYATRFTAAPTAAPTQSP